MYWADDVPGDQYLIRTAMADMRKPPAVRFFADGKSLLDAVAKHKPDLVVLDISMPVLDGFDVLRKLRAKAATADLPVIIFSIARRDEDFIAATQLGVLDFVEKPADYDAFAATVARILKQVVKKRPPAKAKKGEGTKAR